MLDIRFVRENPEAVKENIRKKFQEDKLPLVDEVIKLDAALRAAIQEADELRSNRKKLSKQVGMLMGQAKKDPSKAQEAGQEKRTVGLKAIQEKRTTGLKTGQKKRTTVLKASQDKKNRERKREKDRKTERR